MTSRTIFSLGCQVEDDDITDSERADTLPHQSIHESGFRWRGENALLVRGRVEQHCAVFGHNAIEKIEVWENAPEVREFPAGDENQLAPGPTESL